MPGLMLGEPSTVAWGKSVAASRRERFRNDRSQLPGMSEEPKWVVPYV